MDICLNETCKQKYKFRQMVAGNTVHAYGIAGNNHCIGTTVYCRQCNN